MGSDSSPTRVRRPDGAGAVNAAVPDDQIPASSVACGGAGRTERASVLRPTSTGGSPCPPPNPSRVGVVAATAASLTNCSYGLTPAGDRPRSRYGSPRPHLVQEVGQGTSVLSSVIVWGPEGAGGRRSRRAAAALVSVARYGMTGRTRAGVAASAVGPDAVWLQYTRGGCRARGAG